MNNDLNMWIEKERKKISNENFLMGSESMQISIYNQLVISNEIGLKILETMNKTGMSIPFETFKFKDVSRRDLTTAGTVVPETIDKMMEDVKFL